MPFYEFRCRTCGLRTTTMSRETPECEVCKLDMTRKFSFTAPKMFEPHYNISVGQFVNSKTEFNEALKLKSEEATARTGIYHNYVPVDNMDRDAFAPTEEGMDDFHRKRNDDPVASDDPFQREIMA